MAELTNSDDRAATSFTDAPSVGQFDELEENVRSAITTATHP